MKTHQIVISIVGAGVAASLTQAASMFPDLSSILSAGNVLVIAIITYFVKTKPAE